MVLNWEVFKPAASNFRFIALSIGIITFILLLLRSQKEEVGVDDPYCREKLYYSTGFISIG